MEKVTKVAVVLTTLFLGALINVRLAQAQTLNQSGIAFRENEVPGQVCAGTLPKSNLNEMHLDGQLATGVPCVAGDFDGNGYIDFLLYGESVKHKGGGIYPSEFHAVFFRGKSLIKTLTVQHRALSHPTLYASTDKPGEFGEPITPRDGFVEWGEGGSTYVFLFDPKTNAFKVSEHASENE